MLKKRYEAVPGITPPGPIVGNQADVPAEPFLGNPAARLQMLLPDEMPLDLAMNIFTFDPGHSLPYVETHVMEHGLYFLQGKGVYYLDDEWMEVEDGRLHLDGPLLPAVVLRHRTRAVEVHLLQECESGRGAITRSSVSEATTQAAIPR